jgi:hypothetical protein
MKFSVLINFCGGISWNISSFNWLKGSYHSPHLICNSQKSLARKKEKILFIDICFKIENNRVIIENAPHKMFFAYLLFSLIVEILENSI